MIRPGLWVDIRVEEKSGQLYANAMGKRFNGDRPFNFFLKDIIPENSKALTEPALAIRALAVEVMGILSRNESEAITKPGIPTPPERHRP